MSHHGFNLRDFLGGGGFGASSWGNGGRFNFGGISGSVFGTNSGGELFGGWPDFTGGNGHPGSGNARYNSLNIGGYGGGRSGISFGDYGPRGSNNYWGSSNGFGARHQGIGNGYGAEITNGVFNFAGNAFGEIVNGLSGLFHDIFGERGQDPRMMANNHNPAPISNYRC